MLGLAGVGGGLYAVKQGLAEVITTSKEFEAIGSRMEYAFGGMQGAGELEPRRVPTVEGEFQR